MTRSRDTRKGDRHRHPRKRSPAKKRTDGQKHRRKLLKEAAALGIEDPTSMDTPTLYMSIVASKAVMDKPEPGPWPNIRLHYKPQLGVNFIQLPDLPRNLNPIPPAPPKDPPSYIAVPHVVPLKFKPPE